MEQNNNLGILILIARDILSEVELLTSATKAAALVRFQSEFLNTEQRRKIYEAIDGDKDSQAIADEANASLRAVQLLIKELTEKDLVDIEKRGRFLIPRKAAAKVATYYARQDIIDAGGMSDG